MEILTAAKNNVATYLITEDNTDCSEIIMPREGTSESKITYQKRQFLWSKPSEAALKEKALAYQQQLLLTDPSRQQAIFYSFSPKKLTQGWSLFPKWELSYVITENTLSNKSNKVTVKKQPSLQNINEAHKDLDGFHLIKLLPLSEKLNKLSDMSLSEHAKSIVTKAIISDMIDELRLYGEAKWHGVFTQEKLKLALTTLNTVIQYIHAHKNTHTETVVFHYQYALKRLPSFTDKWFLPFLCRRNRLQSIGFDLLHGVMNHMTKSAAQQKQRDYAQYDKVSREELLHQFSHPFGHTETITRNQTMRFFPQSITTRPPYKKENSTFKMNSHLYMTQSDEKVAIGEIKKDCQFTYTKDPWKC
jgi:hypothetical protein